MLLKHLKYALAKNNSTYLFRRLISNTIRKRASVKTTSENVENQEQKAVESHRPLTENEIQKIINLDNIHITTKSQQKLPQRPALIKNFFIGKIDTELLTYPEVMEVKDFNALVEDIRPITNYFVDSARTEPDLRFRDVSNQMISDFQRLKLFGASVPERFGGKGLFKSELNYAIEAEASDIKSFSVLAGHRLAVEAISDHGNFSHHSQYLMEMAKGETIGAICLPDLLKTNDSKNVKISKTTDGDYVLNGSKSFAICSQHANVLVVVAEKSDELKEQYEIDEDDDTDDDDYFDAYMAIVLDPKSSGITIIDEIKTIGCNDVPFKSIHFSNVRIGKDQILSEGIDDRKTSQKLIASARLQESTLNMIQAKNLLNRLTEFCIKTVCNSEKMRNLVYVRNHLAKLACEIYGLESMIYLTTGIIDQFDNPKVELECAVTKVYSQEILQKLSQIAMSLIGSPVTVSGHSIDIDIMDITQLQFNEKALKSYIGQVGLQHAIDFFGNRASDYKDSIWSKMGYADTTVEDINDKYYLNEFLHPTLIELATDLEYSILRLQCCAEILLNRYEKSVSERQTEIEQLGEIVMQNYAMFASLARASRAYCIGLRYSVHETVAAGCLTEKYSRKILKRALDIKHNRSGLQSMQKTIVDNVLERHRNQSIAIPSVLHSSVIQKHVK